MNELIIDISQHNGNIDFAKVKRYGVKGCIIRVGWIGNHDNHTLDTKFEEYYNGAKEQGLPIGFYVYSYCKTIENLRKGTMWVLDKIQNKKFELPIFLDLEDATISGLGRDNLTEQALNFCRIIESSGYKAGVYANKYWWENKLEITRLLNYKIWLADWGKKYNHSLSHKVDLWQYGSDGYVDGIEGRVDLNKCLCECLEKVEETENKNEDRNGDEVEVKRYVNGSTIEIVYSDTKLTKNIGYLNPRESCECLGIFENRAMVRYKVDRENNYKIGFVKWLGGVK